MSSIRDFVPLDKLGQGTYSNVYKVRRNTDQQIYALKKVKMNSLTQKQKQNSLNQVRILASLQSQYIVQYKQAFFDQNLNVLCVVMQYANDGDLQKYIKQHIKSYKLILQDQIWKAAEHIIKGLNHLHNKGIMHRDIKCANIFKSKGVYKLGDLNVSKVNSNGDKMAHTQTGTPYYASPEVWRDQPYDLKSDIWSFGCIIYEMAALKPPFNGKDMEDLFKNIQKGKFQSLSAHYSSQLQSFIDFCLQKDPKKRPNTEQLIKKINQILNKKSSLQIKVNNPENKSNMLLKTIKVPSDLKKLNQALPDSKYKKSVTLENNLVNLNFQKKSTKENNSCVLIQNKSQYYQYQIQESTKGNIENKNNINSNQNQQKNKTEQIQIFLEKQKKQSVKKEKTNLHVKLENNFVINNSKIGYSQKIISPRNHLNLIQNSYKSPKSKIQNKSTIIKSPASQVRLSKKVESSFGISQRYQKSDRKPNTSTKIQRIHRGIDLDNSIKQITQRLKKPISIPRTEKKQTLISNNSLLDNSQNYRKIDYGQSSLINNSNLMKYQSGGNQYQSKINANNLNNKYEILDQIRNKLVKKTRILSNNQPKPSWW